MESALRLGFARLSAPGLNRSIGLFLLTVALTLAGCLAVRILVDREAGRAQAAAYLKTASRGFSDRALTELMAGAGAGVIRFAVDHDPDAPQAAWERPPGWKRLDVVRPPTLDLGRLSMAEAQRINGVIPNSQFDNPPMTPFVLRASAAERTKAVGCLTAAIYYEGALEPREGQEAIAQVVINRMRHAGFPKSVCGVVFQGAQQPGCQFTFACDGSMGRPPAAWAWRNAKDVAERALNGYVMKAVGAATHYHTNWIIAPWTPTLIKIGQFGSQIFFRPTGPEGEPSAFREAYLGGEARTSRLDLIGKPQLQTPALLQASAPGSAPAPASIVRDGHIVMLPAGALQLARLHGVLVNPNMPDHPQAPMHTMIALRAAAARAALEPGANPIAAAIQAVDVKRDGAQRQAQSPAPSAPAAQAEPIVLGAAGR
jgi:spore germination cell wall hydrolase CwlJ-like protein